METKFATRPILYKKLYLAAKSTLPNTAQDCDVKAFRDHTCWNHFQKAYDDLEDFEIQTLIEEFNDFRKENLATKNQVDMFHFYSLSVALHYCPMDGWSYKDSDTNVELKGNELRQVLQDQFSNRNLRLPKSIVGRIFEEWINPKANQFLMEGGYKIIVRNPKQIYYEQLKNEEIRYLISRFQLIHNELSNKNAKPIKPSNN